MMGLSIKCKVFTSLQTIYGQFQLHTITYFYSLTFFFTNNNPTIFYITFFTIKGTIANIEVYRIC